MLRKFLFTPKGKFRIPIIILGSFIVSFLGFIPGMGLLGALFLGLGDTVLIYTAGWFGYESIFNMPYPDTWAWPTAIMMTFITFPIFVLSYLVGFRFFAKKKRWQQWAIWIATVAICSAIGTACLWLQVQNFVLERGLPAVDSSLSQPE